MEQTELTPIQEEVKKRNNKKQCCDNQDYSNRFTNYRLDHTDYDGTEHDHGKE